MDFNCEVIGSVPSLFTETKHGACLVPGVLQSGSPRITGMFSLLHHRQVSASTAASVYNETQSHRN